MPVRVSWPPNPESFVAGYVLEKGSSLTGPWTRLVYVPHDFADPSYNATLGQFVYNDGTGAVGDCYRMVAVDDQDHRSPPSIVAMPRTSRVDHDFGGTDALAYLSDSGVPIGGATVRVFEDGTEIPVAQTTTDDAGRWVDAVYLNTGATYTVVFQKANAFGPNSVQIVV